MRLEQRVTIDSGEWETAGAPQAGQWTRPIFA